MGWRYVAFYGAIVLYFLNRFGDILTPSWITLWHLAFCFDTRPTSRLRLTFVLLSGIKKASRAFPVSLYLLRGSTDRVDNYKHTFYFLWKG